MNMATRLLLLCCLTLITIRAWATDYYVDPDYSGGTRNGNAATPWQSLADTVTNTPWTVINTALAGGAVNVYFSARNASADTDQASIVQLLLSRTDISTNRLSLYGNTQYNTNDSAPSWAAYSGSSHFKITVAVGAFDTNNEGAPYTHRDYSTVHGFKFIATDQPVVILNTNHFVFEYNDVTAQMGAAIGPGVIYQHRPVSDPVGPYETDITISHNSIHNTYGEAIYISGSFDGSPPGNNDVVTQQNVTISYNTITDPGTFGGQGDGIDIKDGNVNLQVIGNHVDLTNSPAVSNRCITLEAGALISGNYLVNCTTNGLVAGSAYVNSHGKNGMLVQNNIVVAGANSALKFDSSDGGGVWTNTAIENNTFLKPASSGTDHIALIIGFTGVTLLNNIFLGYDTYQCLRYDASNVTFTAHDYNSYYNTTSNFSWVVGFNGGTTYDKADIPTWEAHSITADPSIVSHINPYLDTNFKLQSGSPAKDAGIAISPAFNDYFGSARPSGSGWDMGAAEFVANPGKSGRLKIR